MNEFKPDYIKLETGDLAGADVDFFEYELKLPVVYVNDSGKGELGAIALDGRFRTFPLNELYSYNAIPLSKDEFMAKYPQLAVYFTQSEKQAA